MGRTKHQRSAIKKERKRELSEQEEQRGDNENDDDESESISSSANATPGSGATCMIRPLTRGQKLFLQRLLASHCLSDEDTRALYDSIKSTFATNTNEIMGRSLEHCIGIINRSLVPAFQLEIQTVVLPLPAAATASGSTSNDDDDNNTSTNPKMTRYHAVVNKEADTMALSSANPHRNPHEMAFIRLVLEKIVENGLERDEQEEEPEPEPEADNEEEENENQEKTEEEEEKDINNNHLSTKTTKSKTRIRGCCSGALSRMDIINLRMELTNAHADKIHVKQAEFLLDLMEQEGWIVPRTFANDSDYHVNDDDDDDDASVTSPGGDKVTRKKKKKRKISRGDKSSNTATYMQLGPRAYMEITNMLIDWGLQGDQLPQFILHG